MKPRRRVKKANNMPKVKTKKIITKRFRITKKGKVLRGQSFHRHLNSKKSSRRRRKLGRVVLTGKFHARKIRKALGVRTNKKVAPKK